MRIWISCRSVLYRLFLHIETASSKKNDKIVNTNLLLIDFKNIFMPVFHGISYVGVIKCGVDAVYLSLIHI